MNAIDTRTYWTIPAVRFSHNAAVFALLANAAARAIDFDVRPRQYGGVDVRVYRTEHTAIVRAALAL